ncbi:MAG: hypothetical protein WB506_12170, partial [Candidatus Sulfotelmatobacter sp.]
CWQRWQSAEILLGESSVSPRTPLRQDDKGLTGGERRRPSARSAQGRLRAEAVPSMGPTLARLEAARFQINSKII